MCSREIAIQSHCSVQIQSPFVGAVRAPEGEKKEHRTVVIDRLTKGGRTGLTKAANALPHRCRPIAVRILLAKGDERERVAALKQHGRQEVSSCLPRAGHIIDRAPVYWTTFLALYVWKGPRTEPAGETQCPAPWPVLPADALAERKEEPWRKALAGPRLSRRSGY